MDIVVFGAGSLGSLLGGLLAPVHDVTLVGREGHVAAIQRDGLRIAGEREASVHPDAATVAPASADLALVTVKAYDTAVAAEALADRDLDAVLSLQNGLGNEETLASRLDCPVLAGTCTYGARLVDRGHVECTGVGEVVLGPREGGQSVVADEDGESAAADDVGESLLDDAGESLADDIGEAFLDAGLATTVAADMPRRLWEKLAVNAAINPITALARVPNGALADGPAATIANNAARETARVARANGIDLADERAVAATERVIADTAANRSSMLQDVERERRTEIDAINGAVVERARRGDDDSVRAPINGTLAALVHAWESDRGFR